MRRRAARFAIVLASFATVALAAACNALTGVSDLGTSSGGESCDACATEGAAVVDGRVDPMSDARVGDGSVSADAAGRPSYCTGIVMYLPLDGTLTTAEGVAPDMPVATPFAAGKYGSAASLFGASAALYYPNGVAGVAYPKAAGTLALWFKPQWTWPAAVNRVIFKPTFDRSINSNTAGPYIRNLPSMMGFGGTTFGTTSSYTDGGALDIGPSTTALTPYWKDQDFNHVAVTWAQSAPTLTFTLNGAAGDPTVTHTETDAAWAPPFPSVAFVRLGSNVDPSDGTYDDVVMWSRVLSVAELASVAASTKPVGAVCGL